MRRFYLPDLQAPVLTGAEAHHCLNVLRLKPGDTLTVFDGRGHEALGRITAVERDTVRLQMLSQSTSGPRPWRITLAQAIPKRSMDLIVQKAAELGVVEIIPLVSDRTIVQPRGHASHKVDRWREIVLEACKQCGTNWLPEVHPPRPVRELLGQLGPYDLRLIGSLQPEARPLREVLRGALPARPATPPAVLVVIGPEGDFTPAELAAAKSAGCQPVSFGPLVLRSETAALFVLSVLHYELQE
ncbi:16S rRNA (uracil(1498)-N(3))-methyltransferase [bacterium]|nr:16S rRNA (uracil(1498)-N(3))-methyltransferase [bacterium]